MKKTFFILLAAVLLTLLPAAALAATATVKYMDENGVEQSHECIIMESGDDYTLETGKWYAVTSNVTIKNRIQTTASENHTCLILADGCMLTAQQGISCIRKDGEHPSRLVIYGQSNGTGTLIADASSTRDLAGIGGYYGGRGGEITINGGTVIAKGGLQAAGIGSGTHGNFNSITINGGTVTAEGDMAPGLGLGYDPMPLLEPNKIIINGGTVTAIVTRQPKIGSPEPAIKPGSPYTTVKDNMIILSGDSRESAKVTDIGGIACQYVCITPGVKYSVSHMQQSIYDPTVYVLADKESMHGLPGYKTEATAKNYDGFTAQSFEQKEISADGETTVYVRYSRNNYYVHFVPYKCKGPVPISARYGAEVTVDTEDLSLAGYIFNGWYEDEACTRKFNMPQTITMPSHDIKIYAGWTAKNDTPYTVKYYDMAPDGTGYVLRETLLLTGTTDEYTAAEAPVRDGFAAKPFSQKQIAGDGSTVVEIYYDRNRYTITFDANGHGTAPKPIIAYYEQTISEPASPKPDGEYVFSGWYEDRDCTQPYTFTVMPLDGKALYAGWTSDPSRIHTVTWKLDDKTVIDTTKVTEGDMPAHADPEPPYGYLFDGWEPALAPVTGDTVYTAKLVKDVSKWHTVTWKMDTGEIIDTTQVLNGAMPEHADPSKTGCLFAGWEPALSPAAEDTVYTARFEKKEPYRIIQGANQVILTTANSAVFSSNADFGKFVRVEVDGKTVSPEYYSARSGSTVITFLKAFIAKLKEGAHTLRIVSSDGSASTGFTVASVPKTGDSANPALWAALFLAGAGIVLAIFARNRKRKGE